MSSHSGLGCRIWHTTRGGSCHQLLVLLAEHKRPRELAASMWDLGQHRILFHERFKHGWARTSQNWGRRKYVHLINEHSLPALLCQAPRSIHPLLQHSSWCSPTHKATTSVLLLWTTLLGCYRLEGTFLHVSTGAFEMCLLCSQQHNTTCTFYFSILAKQLKLFPLWTKLMTN